METKTKHTPGPWEYLNNVGKRPQWELVGRKPIHEDDPGQYVARIWQCEDAEANARLMAAAPELLEACKKLITEAPLVKGSATGLWKYLEGWIEKAEEAIAKAEGRL